MAIHGSGTPLFMTEIQTESGGAAPISLSEYYRGGAYTTSNNTGVPTSGSISMSQFFGAVKYVPGSASYTAAGTYSFTVPAGVYNLTGVRTTGAGGGGGSGGGRNPGPDWLGLSAGGGGSGYTALTSSIAVTPGQVLTVVVGAGGAGGAVGASYAGGNNGASGGASQITGGPYVTGGNGGTGGPYCDFALYDPLTYKTAPGGTGYNNGAAGDCGIGNYTHVGGAGGGSIHTAGGARNAAGAYGSGGGGGDGGYYTGVAGGRGGDGVVQFSW